MPQGHLARPRSRSLGDSARRASATSSAPRLRRQPLGRPLVAATSPPHLTLPPGQKTQKKVPKNFEQNLFRDARKKNHVYGRGADTSRCGHESMDGEGPRWPTRARPEEVRSASVPPPDQTRSDIMYIAFITCRSKRSGLSSWICSSPIPNIVTFTPHRGVVQRNISKSIPTYGLILV